MDAPSSLRPLTPSLLALAWRQGWRDLRAGELHLLVLAIVLAVMAMSSVGFFAGRLQDGLTRDAGKLLGGDAVVASDQPLPAPARAMAQARGLQLAQTMSFPSMARAPEEKGGAVRLVAVKAVDEHYPLRGELTLAGTPGQPDQIKASGPARGQVWADAAVLDALDLKVGDEMLLGDASLRVDAVIRVEPDRGAGFMNFAPRVMLHASDLAATGLVQPASRITYRMAVAAPGIDTTPVREFVREIEATVKRENWRGVRVESLESGRPEMRQTLDRAGKFLNLVALLAALLAAVAVALASREFASRHLDDCAMLRVLGLAQRRIAAAYMLEFGAVGIIASLVGVAGGWAAHHAFLALLASLITVDLPPPGMAPAVFGVGMGVALMVGFGLPPVLQLARVPPLRVLRQDVGQPKALSLGVLALGAAGFAGLLLVAASDRLLGLVTVGGFGLAAALFAGLGWLAVWLLRRAVPELGVPRWLLLATRQIAARPGYTVVQIAALSVGLLALVLLVLLRTDLISSWRASNAKDTPDRFVLNLQPDQVEPFRAALAGAGVKRYDLFPMFRGRLVAVNDKPVRGEAGSEDRAQRLAEREFNLSHSAQVPENNRVVAGRWVADEGDGLSVEEGLAQTLGIKLGDRLRFDVAGQALEARITSIRRLDWRSMRVNFFVIVPRAHMDGVPVSHIAAFRAPPTPPEAAGFDRALSREFPNITSVDVSASVAQVQGVLDQVTRAVELLFGFTLATGLVVLLAAVTATRESRSREYAIMRALGAGRSLLARMQRAELLGVGALAGALAAAAAWTIGWVLATRVFEFPWQASPWVVVAGSAVGALLAWAAGWWGLRGVLERPVVETLRRAAT